MSKIQKYLVEAITGAFLLCFCFGQLAIGVMHFIAQNLICGAAGMGLRHWAAPECCGD